MAMLNSQRVYSWENHEFWGALFSDNPFSMHWYADGFSTLEQMGRIKLQYTTRTCGLISYHIISHKRSGAVRHRWNIDIHWPHIYIHIRICQATCDPSGWFLLLHSWKPWVSLTHEALHYSMDLNFCVVSNDKEWTLSLCPYISLNCCPCLAIHLPTAGVFIEIPKLNMSTITIKNVSRLVL